MWSAGPRICLLVRVVGYDRPRGPTLPSADWWYYSNSRHYTTARNGPTTRRSQSTAIPGRCCDTTRIGTEDTLLEPDRIGENVGAYGGRSTVTDRDTRDGDRVSREPAGGNVTVVVRG
jgi:hypothetical protein